jgi:hypothetical protein
MLLILCAININFHENGSKPDQIASVTIMSISESKELDMRATKGSEGFRFLHNSGA